MQTIHDSEEQIYELNPDFTVMVRLGSQGMSLCYIMCSNPPV